MTKNKHWIFLEKLRRSGTVNMFGAVPYIMHEFNVAQNDAKEILANWMRNYRKEDYED